MNKGKDKIKRVLNAGRTVWVVGRVVAPVAAHLAVTSPSVPTPQPVVQDPDTSQAHSLVIGADKASSEQIKQLALHRKQQLEDERRRDSELGFQLREPESHPEREIER